MSKKRKSTPSNNFTFFPIPKLTCLVQNFNIPKPLIHPPGSDPYQFLNTTPHRYAEFPMDPIDPMILDPCVVASRFEVVPKTTHLTASEHAGVFLSETATTKASTAISKFPARSEIIADDVLVVPTNKSDVVVTKIEFDNTPMPAECKVKKDNVVTKTESVVVVKEIESDVEERKHENVVGATNTDSKNGKLLICDVCKVTCSSELVFKRHVEGKIHMKNMLKRPVSSVIKQETSPLVVNNDAFDKESVKKKDLLQNGVSINSFYCSVPPLSADNQTIQNVATEQVIAPLHMEQLCANASHLSNGRTQKDDNLKDSETIVVPPSITPIMSLQTTPIYKHDDELKSSEGNFGGSGIQWCEVCKVSYASDCFNTHRLGKKHLKNLNKPNDASSLQCELCGVCCKTFDEIKKHKLGKKHLKNLKRSEQQIPASDTLSSYDEERKVVSKRKANGSFASEEIGDAKKQKLMEEEVVGSGAMIICKVCNVVCTDIMAFKYHVSSKEHATMALKQVNEQHV